MIKTVGSMPTIWSFCTSPTFMRGRMMIYRPSEPCPFQHSGRSLDAVVVTGDLTDHGKDMNQTANPLVVALKSIDRLNGTFG